MTQPLDALVTVLAAVPAVEWFAVALALGYLWLAIRQHRACWAFAIASSTLYLALFFRAGLTMQSLLQIYFIGMAVYGWWSWRGTSRQAPAAVHRWPASLHLLAVAVIVTVSAINGLLLERHGTPSIDPAVSYVDAAIAWGSVFTTWLVARKVLENWWYWIAIDLMAAMLYFTQGLQATAVLYLLYAALAVQGYRRWIRDERTNPVASA